ncbi:MAG: TonB-dependent receptor domain-containing protein [Acidobacteriota bacterium]
MIHSAQSEAGKVRFVVLLLLAFMVFQGLAAQTTVGSLSGFAFSPNGTPQPGVVVVLSGPALQGERTAVTDAGGRFLLPNLPPGTDYRLLATAEEGARLSLSDIVITSGTASTLNVFLGAGSTEITVDGFRPVTPRQAAVPATLTREETVSMPVLGEFQDRSYQTLLYFAPTATHSRLSGNPAVGGATGIENVTVIDGLTLNDPVTGTFGTHLNHAFLYELSTEAFGVEASKGTSTGAFINLLTRSGSNEFHGEVFGWTTGAGWTARENSNDFEITEGRPWRAVDAGFSVSGPIVKDRLWYYVGANPYFKNEEDRGQDVLQNTRDGRVFGVAYDYDKTWRTTTFFGKLTYRPRDGHSLELSLFGDPSRQHLNEGTAVTLFPESRKSRRLQGSANAVLRWTATLSPRLFLDAHAGATHRRDDLKPWDSGADGYGRPLYVSQDWDQDLGVSAGFGRFTIDDRRTRQIGAAMTWTPEGGRLGSHEWLAGFEADLATWSQTSGYTGGFFVQLRKQISPDLTDPDAYQELYVNYLQDPSIRERGFYGALFLQDRWNPVEDVTVTAGLRWERNRLDSERGNDLSLTNLSPRAAVSWDFTGDDRSKLSFSWGRYYERVPLYLSRVLDAGHATYKDTYVNGVKTAHAIYSDVPAFALGGVKNQSQDEWTVTLQHQFGSNLVLGARAVYRDLNRLLETVGYVDPSTGAIRLMVMNPGHQSTPLLETWRSVLPDYVRFPKPRRRYGALELLLDKRFADRWFLHANYTWSRLRGNTAAGYDRGIPELAPNATKEWDIPSAAWIANRYGYLPTDRTHQFKAVAGYRFDGGLLVGGTLRFDTGRPMYKIYDWPKKEVGYGKLLQVPRGTAGRLPSALTLNLHAEYTFQIKGSTLTAFVDAFNALNDQVEFRVEETYYDTRSTYSEPLRRNPGWGKTRSRTEPRALAAGFRWAF